MQRTVMASLAAVALCAGAGLAHDPARVDDGSYTYDYDTSAQRPATTRQETMQSPGGTAATREHRALDAGRSTAPYALTGSAPSGAVVQGTELRGRISSVDRDDGVVTIALSNGRDVTLVFPQSSLASFERGDAVTLTAEVGMAEVPHADGSRD